MVKSARLTGFLLFVFSLGTKSGDSKTMSLSSRSRDARNRLLEKIQLCCRFLGSKTGSDDECTSECVCTVATPAVFSSLFACLSDALVYDMSN